MRARQGSPKGHHRRLSRTPSLTKADQGSPSGGRRRALRRASADRSSWTTTDGRLVGGAGRILIYSVQWTVEGSRDPTGRCVSDHWTLHIRPRCTVIRVYTLQLYADARVEYRILVLKVVGMLSRTHADTKALRGRRLV